MRRQQRGMALLIVLMIVATMAALATVMQEHWLQSFSRSRVLHSRMTDKWAVLGAEAVIRHHYAQALSAPVLRPASVGKMTWLKLDGLVFNVAVRDLQACFNLNALFGNDKKTAKRNSVATGENTGSEQQEDAAKEPEKDYAQQVFIRLLVNTGNLVTEGAVAIDSKRAIAAYSHRRRAASLDLRALREVLGSATDNINADTVIHVDVALVKDGTAVSHAESGAVAAGQIYA